MRGATHLGFPRPPPPPPDPPPFPSASAPRRPRLILSKPLPSRPKGISAPTPNQVAGQCPFSRSSHPPSSFKEVVVGDVVVPSSRGDVVVLSQDLAASSTSAPGSPLLNSDLELVSNVPAGDALRETPGRRLPAPYTSATNMPPSTGSMPTPGSIGDGSNVGSREPTFHRSPRSPPACRPESSSRSHVTPVYASPAPAPTATPATQEEAAPKSAVGDTYQSSADGVLPAEVRLHNAIGVLYCLNIAQELRSLSVEEQSLVEFLKDQIASLEMVLGAHDNAVLQFFITSSPPAPTAPSTQEGVAADGSSQSMSSTSDDSLTPEIQLEIAVEVVHRLDMAKERRLLSAEERSLQKFLLAQIDSLQVTIGTCYQQAETPPIELMEQVEIPPMELMEQIEAPSMAKDLSGQHSVVTVAPYVVPTPVDIQTKPCSLHLTLGPVRDGRWRWVVTRSWTPSCGRELTSLHHLPWQRAKPPWDGTEKTHCKRDMQMELVSNVHLLAKRRGGTANSNAVKQLMVGGCNGSMLSRSLVVGRVPCRE